MKTNNPNGYSWERLLSFVWVCTQSCQTLCDPMDWSLLGSSVHEIFPGTNIRVDCHFLLQLIFLTQSSNPCLLHLLHWQVDSLPSEPPGKLSQIINCHKLLICVVLFITKTQSDKYITTTSSSSIFCYYYSYCVVRICYHGLSKGRKSKGNSK